MNDKEKIYEAEEQQRVDEARNEVIRTLNDAMISPISAIQILSHLLTYTALEAGLRKPVFLVGMEYCYDTIKDEHFPDISPSDLN